VYTHLYLLVKPEVMAEAAKTPSTRQPLRNCRLVLSAITFARREIPDRSLV
jgi:hypothetical protein